MRRRRTLLGGAIIPAPGESGDAPSMMNAVANTIMMPTDQIGSRMLVMTFMTRTTSRRSAPVAGRPSPSTPRRPRAQ